MTSQDGEWSKLYTVTVTYADFNNYRYDFEHVKIGTVNRSNYDIFYELDPQERKLSCGRAVTPIRYDGF